MSDNGDVDLKATAGDSTSTNAPVVSSNLLSVLSNMAPTESRDSRHTAVAAVFETNELLHHILLHLPVEFRARTRRVSSTWNDTISRIGYHIDPLPAHEDQKLPNYPSNMNIRRNPITDGFISNLSSPRYTRCIACKLPCPRLPQSRVEFITAPPITQIRVSYLYRGMSAILRVHDGIRIGDLMDTLHKMRIHAPERFWCDHKSPEGPNAQAVGMYVIYNELDDYNKFDYAKVLMDSESSCEDSDQEDSDHQDSSHEDSDNEEADHDVDHERHEMSGAEVRDAERAPRV